MNPEQIKERFQFITQKRMRVLDIIRNSPAPGRHNAANELLEHSKSYFDSAVVALSARDSTLSSSPSTEGLTMLLDLARDAVVRAEMAAVAECDSKTKPVPGTRAAIEEARVKKVTHSGP